MDQHATNQAQAIAPHVRCDAVADEIELLERWWRRVVCARAGTGISGEDADVLTLCLRTLRAAAYDAARTVREYERTPTHGRVEQDR
jgi:hypothetical protein